MIGPLAEIAEACDLMPAQEQILPIGIVGTGAILEAAHMPAYRAAGIPVPAIWGRTPEKARAFAERHDIPKVHESLDDLLADPDVAIVDIAVVPQAQTEIALRALDAGKDLMCQKPLAWEIS